MRPAQSGCTRRTAFTLIELVVVLAIILVLTALLTAATMKALGRGNELKNRNDVSQLAAAVKSFQTAYQVRWIPSRIRLREKLDYNMSNSYEADSYQYLTTLFPKLRGRQVSSSGGGTFPWVDWNGNGVVDASPVDLEGDQCLVFFLGGIPAGGATPGVLGFSPDPADPSTSPSTTTVRMGPYYQFFSSRLVDRTGTGFYSYLDAYGKNFVAYFSCYRSPNGYGRYTGTAFLDPAIPGNSGSDCSSLGVSPYAEVLSGTPRFLNPDSFQIISAGADGRFGRGSLAAWTLTAEGPPTWTSLTAGGTPALWAVQSPVTNATPAQDQNAGRDDMSNFHSSFLGTPK
jgi:prepilin-type N-terminal cleavage/methylation domain-containing protein